MSIFRYDNVEWSVPFLFNNQSFIVRFVEKFRKEFEIDLPIKSVYGYMSNAWNGDELGSKKSPMIKSALNEIKKTNLTPVINFSNYHITNEDLNDSFSNELLEIAIENDSELIVSSDILYEYIKKKFPQAKMICSSVKSLYELEEGKEVDFYKRLAEKFDKVTLSPIYVKTKFIQEAEKFEDLSKFEVIVNNTCLTNCDKFKEHNESVEFFELNKKPYVDYYQLCPKHQIDVKTGVSQTLVLSRKDLNTIVNDIGIKYLRLNGFYALPLTFPEIIITYVFDTIGRAQIVHDMLESCFAKFNPYFEDIQMINEN